MKVILRADIGTLGQIGDVVDVANGYGRNYLLPQGKAVFATTGNQKAIENEKKAYLRKEQKVIESLQSVAESLDKISLTIPCQVGEEDKMFGSVTSSDIAQLLNEGGGEVDKRKIKLDSPLNELGKYSVEIKLHAQVSATIIVQLIKEEK